MGRIRPRRAYLLAASLGVVVVIAAGVAWMISLNARARDAEQHLLAARGALSDAGASTAFTEAPTAPVAAPAAGFGQQLTSACSEAQQADALLRDVSGQLQPVMPLVEALSSVPGVGDRAHAQATTLETGAQLASAGAALCAGMEPLSALLVGGPANSGGPDTTIAAMEGLVKARPQLVQAADRLEATLGSIDKISEPELAPSARAGLDGLRTRLPALIQGLRDASALLNLLGDNKEQRFLLVSQNPDELRATGGYIGSAGVLAVQSGRVRLLEYGSSRVYDLPIDRRAATPSPFDTWLGEYWELAGANWWASFPDVARQLAYFYSVARPDQQPVDGVVALDQIALRDLLDVLGPVEVAEYGERVGAADVQTALDRHVHAGDGSDEVGRKQFTAALSAAVLHQLLAAPKAELPSLVRAVRGALEQQHMLVSVWDPGAAAVLARHRWDGALMPISADGLFVVDTEVAASKESQSVERDVTYRVDLSSPARPKARVAITYANVARPHPDVAFVSEYRTFVRIYAPGGARLLSTEGLARQVDPGQECGRSVFGGEVVIPVGAPVKVEFAYELPAGLVSLENYDLLVQQQAGAPTGQFAVEVSGPSGPVLNAIKDRDVNRGYHWHLSGAGGSPADLPLPATSPGGCGLPLVEAAPIAAPVWLDIPSAHISAPITDLGLDGDGTMEAPPTPDVVGWYRTSARAGQPGNAVLSGHVDWGQKVAVFWGLRNLQPADVILLRGADGIEHTYKVDWNRVVSRYDASANELVRGSHETLVTLITCDGIYDRSIREYSDRRIVRASLIN